MTSPSGRKTGLIFRCNRCHSIAEAVESAESSLFWRGLPTKDAVCGVPKVFPVRSWEIQVDNGHTVRLLIGTARVICRRAIVESKSKIPSASSRPYGRRRDRLRSEWSGGFTATVPARHDFRQLHVENWTSSSLGR